MANRVGTQLPDIALQANDGSWVNLSKRAGRTVVFCYPFTGRPNYPNPPDWDNIPGAHGSTPQALAFSACYNEITKLNVKLFGLSLLKTEWQRDFALRNKLPYLLLSDAERKFSTFLHLETFQAGATTFLTRRALIIENGRVQTDIFPVPHPEQNAADVLTALKS